VLLLTPCPLLTLQLHSLVAYLPLLHMFSCSTFSVIPAGHFTTKSVKFASSFLRKQLLTALHTSGSTFVKQLLVPTPTSFLSFSTTSSCLIFTWKNTRPSRKSKKMFSIAATHILTCQWSPKKIRISLFSDVSTALAIQTSPLATCNLSLPIPAPNRPLDLSFHKVLLN
jgi:hypothetical protein